GAVRRLAGGDVLPLLDASGGSPCAGALRRADKDAQVDLLLWTGAGYVGFVAGADGAGMGAVRPGSRPAGDAERVRRSGVCRGPTRTLGDALSAAGGGGRCASAGRYGGRGAGIRQGLTRASARRRLSRTF